MKTFKLTAITATLLAASSFSQLASAEGSLSANIGYVSEYHFRGIQQTDAGSTSAGLDYENGGFYVGTWAADVADGLEVDFYAGYGFELDSGIALGAGFTSYQYTGDFDSAYNEINLSAGYEMFSFEYSVGTWDGSDDYFDEDDMVVEGDPEADYSFIGLSLEFGSFSGTIGSWGKDFDGEYFELAYGTEIGGFDVGVGVIVSGADLDDDEAMYFSLSKSFDL
ncbi:TorF family putative porin [Paraglaciecola sp.]|uniref:TorF family putative porin n=1 Tax=Paraglaciecola sp. TaxID=1920173 RepID=UPI00326722B7